MICATKILSTVWKMDYPDDTGLPVAQFKMEDGLLFRYANQRRIGGKKRLWRKQLVIPESLVQTVLRYSHESPAAGHGGRTKALNFLRERFYFPKMWQRTVEHVAKCELCPLYKGGSTKPAPALAYETPDGPFMRVSIDLVTGFRKSLKGNNDILVMIDNFTRA